MYDNEDSVCGIIYNNEPFYFRKNLQGDVIAITDKDGQTVARYTYDAWGVPAIVQDVTEDAIATVNPYRYRSYYYDTETGLYYVSSRYYNPVVGRWINADMIEFATVADGILGHNLFAYCENRVIMDNDPLGCFVIRRWMISLPLDAILMLIPGIGALFAPVKYIAKTIGKHALKAKISTPFIALIKFVAKYAGKIISGFKKAVSYIPFVGKWIAKKIPVSKFTNMIAGATSSGIINKILNLLLPNIDILLSLGGLVSGALDYVFDKDLNNSIWVV